MGLLSFLFFSFSLPGKNIDSYSIFGPHDKGRNQILNWHNELGVYSQLKPRKENNQ